MIYKDYSFNNYTYTIFSTCVAIIPTAGVMYTSAHVHVICVTCNFSWNWSQDPGRVIMTILGTVVPVHDNKSLRFPVPWNMCLHEKHVCLT